MKVKKHKNYYWAKIIFFFSIIGPGIIAANADNDAGGISTYSIVGSEYGTTMLWVLFLLTFSLAVTQEMGVRIGLRTRQGLGGVIREKFGIRWTAFAMVALMIANLGTISAEFAGISASFEIFGISKYIVVPIAALVVWLVLSMGSFKATQKVFLIFSAFYIVYIVNGFLVNPDFGQALHDLTHPTLEWNYPYFLTLMALIGTTITPWGQFFIQSYVVDKGLDLKHYKIEKWEVFVGALITNVVSFFIIISASATLYKYGISIESAKDAAIALKPIAGHFSEILFGFGLFAASMLGAFILPAATAYAFCEAFGWEYGFNNSFSQAKEFYTIIFIAIAIPALLVLTPAIPLIKVMILSQDVNGILLPIILIFVMKIVNDKKIMGKYTNGKIFNFIAWLTIIGIIFASGVLVVSAFL